MTARENLATDLYALGREAYLADQAAEAIQYFRAAAMLSPHFKTCELLGELLMRLGQPGEAVVYLAASAALAPNQARARVLLAEALCVVGDNRLARAQLREAIRINPDYKTAHKLLATLPPDPEDGI